MTGVSRKRLLDGVSLIVGGLTGGALVWYGYLVLEKATLSFAIFSSLLFGSCVLAGLVALTIAHDEPRWGFLRSKHLSKSQGLALGIGGLVFASCSLWFSMSREISVFLQVTFGKGPFYLLKAVGVVGFFYFGWHAWLKFQQVFQPLTKGIPGTSLKPGEPSSSQSP